jgi:hypothetical protein
LFSGCRNETEGLVFQEDLRPLRTAAGQYGLPSMPDSLINYFALAAVIGAVIGKIGIAPRLAKH